MASVEKMIDFAISKVNRVSYSIAYPARLGPSFYDCSSFVYYSLIAGGFLPKGTSISNTEGLFRLNGQALREIYSFDKVRRGDIFIRGYEGYSAGGYGHTGIFLDQKRIIHCNFSYGSVTINESWRFLDRKRSNKERYFRPVGQEKSFAFVEKLGKAIVKAYVNVRTSPSLSGGIVAVYPPDSVIYYDRIYQNEGYVWISYIGSQSKKRRFVSIGDGKKSWVKV